MFFLSFLLVLSVLSVQSVQSVLPVLSVLLELSVAFLYRDSCQKAPHMTGLKSLNSHFCKGLGCCTQERLSLSYNLQLLLVTRKLDVI